jgi:hypothetical protein
VLSSLTKGEDAVQMKDGIYVALICFAVVPIYTQNSTTRADKTNIEATSTPVQDYADQVNGLLRDIHAKLQEISGRREAGELTAQQAQTMKLAATRRMIAGLDAISAVYDARVRSKHEAENAGLVPAQGSAEDAPARPVLSTKNTVSVQEFERRGERSTMLRI